MSFCVKCRSKLPEGASFCPNCGAPVTLQRVEHDEIDGARKVEALIEALKGDKVLVSAKAARALGEIGGARAVEALIETLKEDNRTYEPSEELQLLGAEDVWMRKEAARALAKIGEPAVEPLIEALIGATDPLVSARAIEALGEIGDARAVEPLISELARGEAYKAITALVQIGDARAVEPLIEILKGDKVLVSAKAARALGEIGGARAVEALIEVLKGEAAGSWQMEELREAAAEALSKIGGEEAEKALKQFPTVKGMEKNRDIEGLTKALKDERLMVRHGAAWALDRLGWKPRDDAEKAHYLIAKEHWDELVKVGKPAVEPLIRVLKIDRSTDQVRLDGATRKRALRSLGKIGGERAVEFLNQLLKDKDTEDEAWDALMEIEKTKIEKMEKERDVLGLIAAFYDKRDYPSVEKAVVEALVRVGDERAIGPLTLAWYRSREAGEKRMLYQAIEEIKERLARG